MTTSILRTADAWWVQTATGATKIATTASTTRELLDDRAAIEAAAHSHDTVSVSAASRPSRGQNFRATRAPAIE